MNMMTNPRTSHCVSCGEATVGPIMQAGQTKFHPECFRCCGCQLCIGDDEQYILVGLSTLYCGVCWADSDSRLQNQHVIKVIKIPPLQRDSSQYKLKKDWESVSIASAQSSQNGFNGSSCQLQVGDRIIEINGQSVNSDQSLLEIEKLLNQRTSTVQVTVEQTPSLEMPTRKLEETKFGSLSSLELRSYSDMDKSKDRLSRRSRESRRSNGRCEERAASLSRLSDSSPTPPTSYRQAGLARTLSFREQARSQTCTFRACDLVKGELLGKGFFGQVFKVTHCETEEVMVLKELYRLDEEAQKNFLKEVAVLRRLEHPNVLRFIGVLYKERKLHLITEYIRGGSLREVIQNVKLQLSWTQRTRFALDIACGVAYLHSMGVIHRDLSSHNCLVREDLSVVVADFGLARITSEMSQHIDRSRMAASKRGRRIERKKRYTVVGNPFWMAPEMMKGYKYDHTVDIFSFGIILCELIGRVHADPDFLPRSGDFSLNQLLFLEKFCQGCPEPLYRIAFFCCDLNPDKRPSFEKLAVWLQSVSSSLTRGLPFPKELLEELRKYGNIIESVLETNTTPPSTPSRNEIVSSGKTSSSAIPTNTTNNSFPECTLSSTCSSLTSTFAKIRPPLFSICEVDHHHHHSNSNSNNNNSNNSINSRPALSSPES